MRFLNPIFHPAPRRFGDHAEVLKLRLPAGFALILSEHQSRPLDRRAARSHADRNVSSRYSLRRVDHVAHAVTIATSRVVDRAALTDIPSARMLRPREVDHVNVIANTRAVLGWIIVTINLDVRTLHLQPATLSE